MICTKKGQLELSGSRLELVAELILLLKNMATEDILSFKTIRAAVECAENKTKGNMDAVVAALAEQAGQSYEKKQDDGFEGFRLLMDSIFGRNKAN